MNPYLVPDDDVEIDIREMFRSVFRHWGMLLLAGIVCAAAACGYVYVRDSSRPAETVREVETEAETEQELYEAESELYDKSVSGIQGEMGNKDEYLKNSVLMRINAYDVPTASVVISVSSDDKDKDTALIVSNKYQEQLSNGDYLRKMAKKEGLSSVAYLRELISVSVSSEVDDVSIYNSQTQISSALAAEEQSASESVVHKRITLSAIGEDQDMADRILDAMLQEAEKYGKELGREYHYEVSVGEKRSYSTVSNDVQDRQYRFYNAASSYANVKTNLKNATNSLTAPEEPASAVSGGPDRRTLLKYGLAGFFGGFLILLLFYIIRFLSNDRLLSYKDLSRRFVLRDLGTYDHTQESVAMIDANIRNYAPQARKLLLIGTADKAISEELKTKLQEADSSCGIQAGGNLLSSPDARKSLADADAVILVEQKGVSRYSSMRQETEIIGNSQKVIAGIVIC